MSTPQLLLPGAEWQPSPHRSGTPPRRADLPARGVVHSTETPPGTGGSVRNSLLWPYHLLVEIDQRRIIQMIDLALTSYALKGVTGYETNHAGVHCIQVSIVSYARQMHHLTADDLRWLADKVFGPLSQMCGIPNEWAESYGEGEGIILASTSSPIRLSPMEWLNYSGWLYHQTVPGQDHWDVGKIDWRRIQANMETIDMLNTTLDDKSTFRFINDLPMGATHPLVGVWQEWLAVTGFYKGAITSKKTPATVGAQRRFEAKEFPKAKADGDFEARSWKRLRDRARAALVTPGASDDAVIASLDGELQQTRDQRDAYAAQILQLRQALDRVQVESGELVDAINDARGITRR